MRILRRVFETSLDRIDPSLRGATIAANRAEGAATLDGIPGGITSHFMKFGLRRPSPRKSLAARLSWKRYVRQSLGLRAPRGWGWLTDPRRAAYNRVYDRTTFGWRDLWRWLAR